MTWARLDDNFPNHPKVMAAGPIAALIQVRAICYCARHLTDGFLAEAVVGELLVGLDGVGLYAPRRLRQGVMATVGYDADELDWPEIMLKHGLWERRSGGYFVHDYPKYNPTRAEVLQQRETKRQSGRQGGRVTALIRARAQADAQASAEAPAKAPAKARAQAKSSPRTRTPTTKEVVEPVDSVDNPPGQTPNPQRPDLPGSAQGLQVGSGSEWDDGKPERISGKLKDVLDGILARHPELSMTQALEQARMQA